MKTKLILIVICAIITLSFSFVTVRTTEKSKAETSVKNSTTEPIGGFASEDKL